MSYREQIQTLQNPTFQKIRRIARNSIAHLSEERRLELWNQLNRKVDLINSNELLCLYLWSFGEMHEAKIHIAIESISEETFNNDFTIIDWGCGQGLATICFFDYLKMMNIQNRTKKVILIDPASLSLERAKLHVGAYINDGRIQSVKKHLNDVTPNDIRTGQPVTLHFFSNILDIEDIDLKKLAQNIGGSITGEHYFFCVGPLNDGNTRIEAFLRYFDDPCILAQEENAILSTKGGDCAVKILVFKLEQNQKNAFSGSFITDTHSSQSSSDDNESNAANSSLNARVKQLEDTVSLIQHLLIDINTTLETLKTFCFSYLGRNNHKTLEPVVENASIENFEEDRTEVFNNDVQDVFTEEPKEGDDLQKFFDQMGALMEQLQDIPIDEVKHTEEKPDDQKLQGELDKYNDWLIKFKELYIR